MLDKPNDPRALLLSGTGRYADPEFPCAAATDALAGLLEKAGFDVVIAAEVDAALAWLASPWNWPALLVVNVGAPRDGLPVPGDAAAAAGLRSWLGSGRPLLAVQSDAATFSAVPEWEAVLDGSDSAQPRPGSGQPFPSRSFSYERPDGGRTFLVPLGREPESVDLAAHRELLTGGIAWLSESIKPAAASVPAE